MKRLHAKYTGTCRVCRQRISKGQPIIYWPLNKQAAHEICAAPERQRDENDKFELLKYILK